MARGFRHEDPRCGREHFDRRAGIEWEFGPYANETAYSIPDIPWTKYKRSLERPNRLFFSNEQWAVTEFGLEPLHWWGTDRFNAYRIPAESLLRTRGGIYYWPIKVAELPWDYCAAFEGPFREALARHCKPAAIDDETLKTSFRRAFAIARAKKRDGR